MTPDLFVQTALAAAPARAKPAHGPNYRPVSGDPREHVCATCGGYAVFGQGGAWMCVDCVPDGFFALARGGR